MGRRSQPGAAGWRAARRRPAEHDSAARLDDAHMVRGSAATVATVAATADIAAVAAIAARALALAAAALALAAAALAASSNVVQRKWLPVRKYVPVCQ